VSQDSGVAKPLADLRAALGEGVQANVPLAPRTTFRIGGPADLLFEARTIPELIEAVRLARQYGVPFFVLGNGSNILVRDAGVRGLVIENHCTQFWLDVAEPGKATLHAESGASLPGIANRMARQGWCGLEWAIGVPGTIGGAIVSNAGAHGATITDSLESVLILDLQGALQRLPKTDLAFDYRTSRFKREPGNVILSAEFILTRDDPQMCITRMNEYTEHRRHTQPTEASIGSIFKNPPNDFAGRLIEQAGLKGTRIGNVQVSPVHANFFVNRGGATANEVLALIELVRGRVREKFGIELELEIEIVGSG
jgi:UDP-N-acetylmuramate dehydrogenase